MVQALINLNENTNRILNMIKAKYDLKDKSEAVEFVIEEFIEERGEPELRPEWIKKMKARQKQPTVKIGTLENFRKRYGLR